MLSAGERGGRQVAGGEGAGTDSWQTGGSSQVTVGKQREGHRQGCPRAVTPIGAPGPSIQTVLLQVCSLASVVVGGGCSLSPTVREPHCKVVCDTIPVSEGQEENHQRPTSCDSDHSHIGSSKGTSVRMGG